MTERVYDELADTYAANRPPLWTEFVDRFLKRADGFRPVIDLGCGTGAYLPQLSDHPAGVIGADRSIGMLELARRTSPHRGIVRAEHRALPFLDGSIGGVWARHSLVHTPREDLPMLLRSVRGVLIDGAPLSLSMVADDRLGAATFTSDGDLPGRRFSSWTAEHLDDVLVGAGFVPADGRRSRAARLVDHELPDGETLRCVWAETKRARSIADTVGHGMRMLVCGLNPSLHAADAGVGFVTPGNRFWPAAIEAGLASRERDPEHALAEHGLGMTDLVKRSTPRAAELTATEYRTGLARIERLCEWLSPGIVCFVGLAGWRAAADRHAVAGVQPLALGGRPVYVMPSTSGLNGSSQPADFVGHFRAALAAADRST